MSQWPWMARPDFNLLIALDVLLEERNVARAARRLRLSPSAMSRTLARLRKTMGDPLLVRSGRGLVPTPRATELGGRVTQVVDDVTSILRPAERLDLPALERTFNLRAPDGFVENFGPALIERVSADAPRVRLRFVQKLEKESDALRSGAADLETAVVTEATSPELRTRALFRDRFVGAVRKRHPLSKGRVTAKRYAAARHVLVSRRGLDRSAVDDALDSHGLRRDIATIVSGFAAALNLARASDLVATIPERQTGNLRDGLFTFPLPFDLPQITISLLWHPRFEADAAHRWLRDCVFEVCANRR